MLPASSPSSTSLHAACPQKCATTSLFYHLAKHPGILRSHDKVGPF